MREIFQSTLLIFLISIAASSQPRIYSMQIDDVRITIDEPTNPKSRNFRTILILYALPNGNTTEQTMGKRMTENDDWHFNIQHIHAQTEFLRRTLKKDRIITAYLENNFKSWPLWKRNHPDFRTLIPKIVDTIRSMINDQTASVYLNGHSGGGSFIFGFLDGHEKIPDYIHRISFLDSNYGYDSSHSTKFVRWLQEDADHSLNVFAYNDSVALLNGKPFVSATGGTWYKSRQMMNDLGRHYNFKTIRNDSVVAYKSNTGQLHFFLKNNPDRRIFHTQQVELNGFIHSILCGTALDSKGYKYFGARAYDDLITPAPVILQK